MIDEVTLGVMNNCLLSILNEALCSVMTEGV